jgi:ABC-2 type transport system permease protein
MSRLISWAVVAKTWRDELVLLIAATITAIAFQAVFVAAMAEMAPQALEFWRRFEFLKQLIQSLFSVDLDGEVSMNVWLSVGLAHPLLLTLALGSVIASCTRVISGEMENGTADLLLALPIPRRQIYISICGGWLCTAFCVSVASWVGVALGGVFVDIPEPIELSHFALALTNLFALLVACGGFVMCVASFCNRRSIAVGICIGVLMLSYLIGFLEPFLDFMSYLAWTSILNYYRPTDVVRDGQLDWQTCSSLLAIGGILWTAGLIRYQRRDIAGA